MPEIQTSENSRSISISGTLIDRLFSLLMKVCGLINGLFCTFLHEITEKSLQLVKKKNFRGILFKNILK